MSITSESNTILYTCGLIPSRQGIQLYDFSAEQNAKSKDFKKVCRVNKCKGFGSPPIHFPNIGENEKTPSAAEELFRGNHINAVRKKCEAVCKQILHIPMPKDLLDQCIFIGETPKKPSNSDIKHIMDPIFSSVHSKMFYKIVMRELFGDVIGRLIASNKTGSLQHVMSCVGRTLDQSSLWVSFFEMFLTSEKESSFVQKVHSSPLFAFDEQSQDLMVIECKEFLKNLPTTQHLNLNDSSCPTSWLWWLEGTKRLIKDHALHFFRCASILQNSCKSMTLLENSFMNHCNFILRDLLTALYPLVYPFITQTTEKILEAISAYHNGMLGFNEKKHDSNNSLVSVSVDHQEKTGTANYSFNTEIILSFMGDKISCRLCHFEKYIRLYFWKLGFKNIDSHFISMFWNQEKQTPYEKVLYKTTCFTQSHKQHILERIYVMVKRYSSIIYTPSHHTRGGNMHAAAPETVFNFLKNTFNVQMECFASPNNCYFSKFFSAFPDTDICFGSQGNFLTTSSLPEGAYEVGPPYTEEMLLVTIEQLEHILSQCNNTYPLTFFVFVPEWNDCYGIIRMKTSPWLTCVINGQGYQHLYIIGTQHLVQKNSSQSRYFRPAHTTLCFILQNEAARKFIIIDDSVKTTLALRMQGILCTKKTILKKNTYVAPCKELYNSKNSDWWDRITLKQKSIDSFLNTKTKKKNTTSTFSTRKSYFKRADFAD